jgi:hypothetical protein
MDGAKDTTGVKARALKRFKCPIFGHSVIYNYQNGSEKMTGVKWGQARRRNFGHLKHPR